MQKTTNYGLNKPESIDFYNVEDFNENAEIIDKKLKELFAELANYLLKSNNSKPTMNCNSNTVLALNSVGGTLAWLDFCINGADVGSLGFRSDGTAMLWSNGNYYNILHTGNKPSGTYTGNGSSNTRTVKTGGLGSVIVVWNSGNKRCAFVYHNGAFHVNPADGTFEVAADNSVTFKDGTLTIGTNKGFINVDGYTYYYQVL